MTSSVKIPEPPQLPDDLPPALREWCENAELALAILRGTRGKGTNSRAVTVQDLINVGLINDGDIPG